MVQRIVFSERDVQGDALSINYVCRRNIDAGEVREQVTLRNGSDVSQHLVGKRAAGDVRQVVREGVTDTGAITMVIPQDAADAIGVPVNGSHTITLAGGAVPTVPTVGPVSVGIEGRSADVDAIVFGVEVLIGQIPLEFMDLWIDRKRQRIVPNPASPEKPLSRV